MENNGADNILEQLDQVRILYHETEDARLAERYAWIIVKALHSEAFEHDSVRSRQYLAEYVHLNLPRPSKVHSAILGAAVSMAHRFADFRFALFLRMWNISFLRPEDYVQGKAQDGKAFLSLAERVAKAYMHSLLLRPDDRLDREQLELLRPIAQKMRYYSPRPMLVTRVTKAEVRGRTIRFAHLIDARGLELSCEVHNLLPNPLAPPSDGRHYASVGQVYDVLPREKQHFVDESGTADFARVEQAYLSLKPVAEAFPTAVGYVESYDAGHQHFHVFDQQSRHLVADAAAQRLGQYGQISVKAGDYVLFAPIIPMPKESGKSVFKQAHIISKYAREEGPAAFGLREAKVTYVNAEKKYYSWELVDPASPIVEAGTTEPAFTSGFVSFGEGRGPHAGGLAIPAVGQTIRMVVYLKRGKDRQKRPHVVHVEGPRN